VSAEDNTDLPEAMIEAAVEAVQEWRKEWLARVVAEPSVPSAELQRNGDVAMVEAILAAALSVCDVREEWRAGAIYTTRLVFGDWHDAAQIALYEREPDVRYERRVVIITPATEVSDVD
jgi:hypothetical protein